MPIVLMPDSDSSTNPLKYPAANKVLSGTVYGSKGEFVGTMDPRDHVYIEGKDLQIRETVDPTFIIKW